MPDRPTLDTEAPHGIAVNHVETAGQPGDAPIQGRRSSTREEAPVDGLSLVRQSPLSTGLSIGGKLGYSNSFTEGLY